MTEHTHKQFDNEMEAIRSGVLTMGGIVETQLSRAIVLLEATRTMSRRSIRSAPTSRTINQMQVDLDHQCSQIIAKRQPAAIDLRMILTVTKIVNDLERVGDETKKVARRAVKAGDNQRLAQVLNYDVARAADRAKAMLQLALDAFARLDVEAAAEVIDLDEEIDAAFAAILRQLISYMMEDPQDDHARAGHRVHRQVDRAHRRSRQEHRRGRRAGGDGQGCAARDRRGDPRGGRPRMTPTIMVVEDEPAILELLKVNLVDAGYEVRAAGDAETAQAMLRDALPDLLLLDWMLPGISGLALAKLLRADTRTRELPVIMITARSDEADRVAGLEAWVDDYVTKPFSPRELKARIKSVLRRRAPEAAQLALTAGRLSLDSTTHRVTVDGRPVALGPTEFRLLRYFLARPERVHTRAQLLDQVWGDHVYIEERTVDVHIRRLRMALEPFGESGMIETVRGAGYRLAAPA